MCRDCFGPSAPGAAEADRRCRNPRRGGRRLIAAFGRDLAYGGRLLIARPGFTAVAVLTLALGIGANTAIFSVVHAMLLAPLPFPDPERLVMLWEADVADETARYIVAAPNFQDWCRQSTSFDAHRHLGGS